VLKAESGAGSSAVPTLLGKNGIVALKLAVDDGQRAENIVEVML
jgi:hypothetical protein